MSLRRRLLPLVIAVLFIGGGLLWMQTRNPSPSPPDNGKASKVSTERSTSTKPGGDRAGTGTSGGGRGARLSITVGVATVVSRDVEAVYSARAQVTPLRTVELRPRSSNAVVALHVTEGSLVQTGQKLFSLDSRNEKINLEKARAQVAKDRSNLADAKRQLERNRELLAQQVVSTTAVEALETQLSSAQATLEISQAQEASAQAALQDTLILAPFAGRLGAINVAEGTVLQANSSVITTLTQTHPLALQFSLPESLLQTLPSANALLGMKVEVEAPGGTLSGTVRFVDSRIDPQSGTLLCKAYVNNPNDRLWPGQLLSVRVVPQVFKQASVVPTASLVNQAGKTGLWLAKDGKATWQTVSLRYSLGEESVVEAPGANLKQALVIVQGKQNVTEGASLQLVEEGQMPIADKP